MMEDVVLFVIYVLVFFLTWRLQLGLKLLVMSLFSWGIVSTVTFWHRVSFVRKDTSTATEVQQKFNSIFRLVCDSIHVLQ